MDFVNSPDRLSYPMVRQERGKGTDKAAGKGSNSGFLEISWDEALDLVAKNLKKYKGEVMNLLHSVN